MRFRWDFLQHLSKIDSYFLPLEGNSKFHLCLTGSNVLLTQNFMKSLYEELHENFDGQTLALSEVTRKTPMGFRESNIVP